MRRTARVAGAILGLAVAAGCTAPVERVDVEAAPAGATAAPSAAPSTAPAAGPPRSARVLGPTGLGKLDLGMTAEQAEASGTVVKDKYVTEATAGCGDVFRLRGAQHPAGFVSYSKAYGVAAIPAYGSIATPAGIRIGSSVAAVRRAYPEWVSSDRAVEQGAGGEGGGFADVPGNRAATYFINCYDQRVVALVLLLREHDCTAYANG